jgi:hypothetical protein
LLFLADMADARGYAASFAFLMQKKHHKKQFAFMVPAYEGGISASDI